MRTSHKEGPRHNHTLPFLEGLGQIFPSFPPNALPPPRRPPPETTRGSPGVWSPALLTLTTTRPAPAQKFSSIPDGRKRGSATPLGRENKCKTHAHPRHHQALRQTHPVYQLVLTGKQEGPRDAFSDPKRRSLDSPRGVGDQPTPQARTALWPPDPASPRCLASPPSSALRDFRCPDGAGPRGASGRRRGLLATFNCVASANGKERGAAVQK